MPQQTSPSSHWTWWFQGRMTAEGFFQQESQPYRCWHVCWICLLPLSPLLQVPLCHISALPVLPASFLIQCLSLHGLASAAKPFWSIRSMSSGHPPRPRAGVRTRGRWHRPFLPSLHLHPTAIQGGLYTWSCCAPLGNLNQSSSTKLLAWPVISVASLNRLWHFWA